MSLLKDLTICITLSKFIIHKKIHKKNTFVIFITENNNNFGTAFSCGYNHVLYFKVDKCEVNKCERVFRKDMKFHLSVWCFFC